VGLASLRDLARFGVVRVSDERRLAENAVIDFHIRPAAPDVLTRNLSGGNQQKVVLGKWLVRKPAAAVAILDEPTRGVDVGAKFEIYRLIDALVAEGTGVLLISSELPEVIAMSDRIMVMSDGQVAGTLERDEFSEERILTLALLGRAHHAGDGEPAAVAAGDGSAA
jgi:ribose transport system ATP-binding protein